MCKLCLHLEKFQLGYTCICYGMLQVQMQVLPESHRRLEYNLYPLLSGLVALPKLKLTISPDTTTQQQITEFIERVLPSHVYIMVSM